MFLTYYIYFNILWILPPCRKMSTSLVQGRNSTCQSFFLKSSVYQCHLQWHYRWFDYIAKLTSCNNLY